MNYILFQIYIHLIALLKHNLYAIVVRGMDFMVGDDPVHYSLQKLK